VIFCLDIRPFTPLQRIRQTAKRQTHNSLITFLPEVDFYDYLSAIDVEAYNADSEINFRDPTKKRRRNYKICQITPIDAQENIGNETQQQAHRTTRRTHHAQQSDHSDSDHQAVTRDEARVHNDDESTLMDSDLE
jgi:hypothetical protein